MKSEIQNIIYILYLQMFNKYYSVISNNISQCFQNTNIDNEYKIIMFECYNTMEYEKWFYSVFTCLSIVR